VNECRKRVNEWVPSGFSGFDEFKRPVIATVSGVRNQVAAVDANGESRE